MPGRPSPYNRIGQLTILLGVLCFAFGMFYWLLSETHDWRGIVGGIISLIVSILLAAVFSMEVKDSPRFQPDADFPRKWVEPDDPAVDRQSSYPSQGEDDSWKPDGPPPDAHQRKDPFAT